ncbi:hypothetical protein GALMADRAFT_217436 [Galerina marginata CBS 339.88]|uniref:Uncharacterized protein n=1 Tax=Galerina marginata (strain CBS 339.88) TaxID=685588 RepID=A0A067S700_GALM3|nr:hypothetical protein GALMADRAFT_217436 [Galerina marginata CBS 339.88]
MLSSGDRKQDERADHDDGHLRGQALATARRGGKEGLEEFAVWRRKFDGSVLNSSQGWASVKLSSFSGLPTSAVVIRTPTTTRAKTVHVELYDQITVSRRDRKRRGHGGGAGDDGDGYCLWMRSICGWRKRTGSLAVNKRKVVGTRDVTVGAAEVLRNVKRSEEVGIGGNCYIVQEEIESALRRLDLRMDKELDMRGLDDRPGRGGSRGLCHRGIPNEGKRTIIRMEWIELEKIPIPCSIISILNARSSSVSFEEEKRNHYKKLTQLQAHKESILTYQVAVNLGSSKSKQSP